MVPARGAWTWVLLFLSVLGWKGKRRKGREKGKEREGKERKGCQFFISLFPPLPLLASSCAQLLQHLESLGHRLGLLEDVCTRAHTR